MDILCTKTFLSHAQSSSEQFPELGHIVEENGFPSFWSRPEGFETLVRVILEQQVSLLSAKAAWDRIVSRLGSVTVERTLRAGEPILRECGVTRQKSRYIVSLAERCASGQLVLEMLDGKPDEEVRELLCEVIGIGLWTANVYLLAAMRRTDIWPRGDIAVIRTIEQVFPEASHQDLEDGERWKGQRSVAARLLWHHYLSQPGREKVMDSIL